MDKPSSAEIYKVKSWECKQRGHDYEMLHVISSPDPIAVTCTNCGDTWMIEKKEKRNEQAAPEV